MSGKIPSIPLEINPLVKNTVGTVGMLYNAPDPDTAVSEFYITLADTPSQDKGSASPGFCGFGRLLSVLEEARGIGNLTTSDRVTPAGITMVQVPVKHVRINHVVILTADMYGSSPGGVARHDMKMQTIHWLYRITGKLHLVPW